MAPIVPTLRHERRLWNDGLQRVVGVDEVGVAPTCGAVVAAAVIMRPGCHRIPGVRDSKTLSAGQRERLAPLIRRTGRGGRGRCGIGPRDRPAQHLPRHPSGDAPGDRPGRGPRARAGRRQSDRRVRGAGRAVLEHRRWRRQGLFDRLRVGRGQGRSRSDDGPARGPLSGLRLGAQPGLRHARTPAGDPARSGSRRSIAARSWRSSARSRATSWSSTCWPIRRPIGDSARAPGRANSCRSWPTTRCSMRLTSTCWRSARRPDRHLPARIRGG